MFDNIYTTPLDGTPYYINRGLIKIIGRHNRKYNIGEVVFERYDDQNFQYLIRPYRSEISLLPDGLFQGIPGINVDLPNEVYYRVNMTPELIAMRSPCESRADIADLLSSVGLDYYDRFEWLLRSEMRCGDDNLLIIRKLPPARYALDAVDLDRLSPDDTVEIENFSRVSETNALLLEKTFSLLQCGAKIYIRDEQRFLTEAERKIMASFALRLLENYDNNNQSNRKSGVLSAKNDGKYNGRKPILVDIPLLWQVTVAFRQKRITEREAMETLRLSSRSTFYRKMKSVPFS